MDIPIGAGLVALSVPLTLFVIFCRKQIGAVLEKGFNWKGAGTELSIPAAPPPSSADAPVSTQPVQVLEASSPEPSSKESEREPSTPEEWEHRMFNAALFERDLEKAKVAFQGFQRMEGSAEKKLECELFYDFLRFTGGDTTALDDLMRLADTPVAKYQAKLYIARCYRFAGDNLRALKEFDAIAGDNKGEKYAREAAIDAADCVFKLGREEEAFARLMKELPRVKKFSEKASVFQALASLYERAKEPELRAIALEKALEFAPNDTTFRFGAAYAYAEVSFHRLSYLHYSHLLSFAPNDESALNNIAVQCEVLKMPLRSISNYKKAFEKGNTLAAANLAFRYLGSGFKEEAEKVLEAAKGSKNMHANVGSAIAALAQGVQYEADTAETVGANAAKTQQFLSHFGNAYFTPESPTKGLNGNWFSSKGYFLQIEENDGQIVGHWEESGVKKRFHGLLSNRGARITLERWGYLGFDFKNLQFVEDGRGFIFLSPADEKLGALFLQNDQETYVSFTRLAPQPALTQSVALESDSGS